MSVLVYPFGLMVGGGGDLTGESSAHCGLCEPMVADEPTSADDCGSTCHSGAATGLHVKVPAKLLQSNLKDKWTSGEELRCVQQLYSTWKPFWALLLYCDK